jgi:hypothetical protein
MGSGGTSKVTIRECHWRRRRPDRSAPSRRQLTTLVTKVTQCNDATNGGGGTPAAASRYQRLRRQHGATGATVNQCVGSWRYHDRLRPIPGDDDRRDDHPCNGSANGGTPVGLTCTATGTTLVSQGHDQPVQRLDEWRWSCDSLCEHHEPSRVRTINDPATRHRLTCWPRPTQPRRAPTSSRSSRCSLQR